MPFHSRRIITTALAALLLLPAAAHAAPAAAGAADLPEYPVTVGEADGKITLRYHDPKITREAALLIDTDDDGKANKSIVTYTTSGGMHAHLDVSPYSSESCQETRQGLLNVGVDVLTPSGDVQISADRNQLPRNFTVKAVQYFAEDCDTNGGYPGVPTTMQRAVRFGLPAPTGVEATADDGQVTLSWNAVADAARYRIYVNGDLYPAAIEATSTTLALANGATYSIRVAAVSKLAGIEGVTSAAVSVTPAALPPLPASSYLSAEAGDGQITLVWNPVAHADGYNIYANDQLVLAIDAYRSAVILDAANDVPLRFEVTAVRRGVNGARSPSAYATPRSAVIVSPPVDPQPPVTDPQPPVDRADPDGDGIRNDWTVKGKPAPAPAKAQVKTLAGTSIKLKLPTTPKGTAIAAYFRVPGGRFAKVSGKADKRGVLTIRRLKRSTMYEIKLVRVKGRQQSAASTITVRTRSH